MTLNQELNSNAAALKKERLKTTEQHKQEMNMLNSHAEELKLEVAKGRRHFEDVGAARLKAEAKALVSQKQLSGACHQPMKSKGQLVEVQGNLQSIFGATETLQNKFDVLS